LNKFGLILDLLLGKTQKTLFFTKQFETSYSSSMAIGKQPKWVSFSPYIIRETLRIGY
jgi:hypothetical protein